MRTLEQLSELDWVRHRAAVQPDAVALFETGGQRRSWTWSQFDIMADRLLDALEGHTTVALQSADPFVVAAAVAAALRGRLLLVPLNMRWTDEERAARAVEVGATLILDTAAGERALTHARPRSYGWEDPASTRVHADLDAWLEDAPAVVAMLGCWPGPGADERPVLGLFTSGTTGRPRLALLSARALVASALAGTLALDVQPAMMWALCMPLYHVGGLSILVRAMVRGLTVCVLTDGVRELASAAADAPWNVVSVVPTMLEELVGQGVRAPGALALTLVGGGPARGRTLAAAAELGWRPRFSYGMTECAAHITVGSLEAAAAGRTTVGIALPGTTLRVMPEPDQGSAGPHPDDSAAIHDATAVDPARMPGLSMAGGPLEVWGPSLMLGYLGQPRIAGPWATGDYGAWTPHGELQLLDRRQDLIVSGGENIYPVQIEQVILTHDGLRECCVAAVADDRWGQVPGVLLVAAHGRGSAAHTLVVQAELEELVRAALGSFRVPRRWLWVDAVPRTAAGKVDRAAARALLQATVPT